MVRGYTPTQISAVLGVDRETVFKDTSSIRSYITKELQGCDALALIAESLGLLQEVRASAIKDMDKATTVKDRGLARRDLIRVEAERIRCLIMVMGGNGSRRGMINVTIIESDPVPLLEDQHQKLMEVARKLVKEVFQVEDPSAPKMLPHMPPNHADCVAADHSEELGL